MKKKRRKTINLNDIQKRYQHNWNAYASEVLNVTLDERQQEILTSVQNNKRTSARSGNARGKDYVAAVASLCFLYLNPHSKVINTAPTGRQVISIMMSEIATIHQRAKVPLGGEVLAQKIKIPGEPDWFLEGFKAADKDLEAWTGFHSQNLMVVVTEASGVADITFQAIESILTGDSRLLLVFNPNQMRGESYESTRSPLYTKFKMSCLDAPNVIAKKTIYPGQVNWEWIDEKIRKPGWVTQIDKNEVDPTQFDFEWEGKWYRPSNLARVKILGEFPAESEDALIPLIWVEMANERWLNNGKKQEGDLLLGVDVAGMGRDNTVFSHRYTNRVDKLESFTNSEHTATAGKVKNRFNGGEGRAYIDSIGEGAGVFSICKELARNNNFTAVSAKATHSADKLKDNTGQRTFDNMRAYMYWALRDALDPQFDYNLELPPDDELKQELTETRWDTRSNGKIFIEPKDKIKERIGRSPDKSDSVALTFYPYSRPRARRVG